MKKLLTKLCDQGVACSMYGRKYEFIITFEYFRHIAVYNYYNLGNGRRKV